MKCGVVHPVRTLKNQGKTRDFTKGSFLVKSFFRIYSNPKFLKHV